MTSILSLDVAGITGWAFYKPGMDKPAYGAFELSKHNAGDETGTAQLSLEKKLEELVQRHGKVDVIAYEAAMMKIDRFHSADSAMFLICMAACVERFAAVQGAIVRRVAHKTLMAHWCDSGNIPKAAGKQRSLAAARSKGWPCKYDDTADALGILNWYTHAFKIPVTWDNARCAGDLFLRQHHQGPEPWINLGEI